MADFLTKIPDDQNPIADMEESKIKFMKFSKPGDFIRGTLIDVREIDDKFAKTPNKKQKVYRVKATQGSFHDANMSGVIIEPAIAIQNGEIYDVGARPSIDSGMALVKLGQIVGILFKGTKPSREKGYQPAKIFVVGKLGMDPDFLPPEEPEIAEF